MRGRKRKRMRTGGWVVAVVDGGEFVVDLVQIRVATECAVLVDQLEGPSPTSDAVSSCESERVSWKRKTGKIGRAHV